MKTYTFNGYKLTLKKTDRISNGHIMVKYTFKTPDNKILFSGDDLGSSPLHAPESKQNAIALLTFLTCKPGDVESDYFKDYTPEQLAFSESLACEQLQSYCYESDRIM
jgi:hypothetical protein